MPAIAATYEGENPTYLESVLPIVDFLEITPDTIAIASNGHPKIPEQTLADLERYALDVGIVVHGVGLSIGSADSWAEDYLRLLDQIVERVPIAWHSEHLGYVRVGGQHLGTMLPMPRTTEALDLVSERVERLGVRYGLPFLLENVVGILPDAPAEYSQAGFLNALADRSGCGLLLDLYNLECDAHNNGLDIGEFFSELCVNRVREIHMAAGVEHAGVLLDVHSRPLRQSTIELLLYFLGHPDTAVDLITYELLAEAIPVLGPEVICAELRRLRTAVPA
jgi:uncharacterized protein (UPF0276 family)